jgi:hypothetical protein
MTCPAAVLDVKAGPIRTVAEARHLTRGVSSGRAGYLLLRIDGSFSCGDVVGHVAPH